MIDFYTAATPNGYKVSIMLEECGLEYTPHFIDMSAQQQKSPEFLAINPNGRIPAIVDDGFPVFESGAILIWLADKAGKFLPSDPKGRSTVIQWLMWQMGGLGPMMGQLNVFKRYFPEHIPSAIDRYERESYRLFGVMDGRLADSPYLGGDEYSIADIACWPWVRAYEWPGLTLDNHPHLKAWADGIGGRDAVKRGVQIPPRPEMTDEARKEFVERARKILA
ncbi:glutathione S-transferase family protein [Sphingomonas tabacisoli]|uniref:Glutathione S-transferase family protein n=1 Tax=Sphingomonas tabacisoli TaxID=2249466 RepID=A0ABW4I0A9_9SPHN